MANGGLGLRREQLENYVKEFLEINSKLKLENRQTTDSQDRFTFLTAGQDPATVILYYKTGGLTTITYKTGKNQSLGKVFADFLESKCDSADSMTVNLSLKGISLDNLNLILTDLRKEKVGDDLAFEVTEHHPTAYTTKYEIRCAKYKDNLTLLYQNTTYKLQIQGRALFIYRTLTYMLSILLDQSALLSVIEKSNIEDVTILHEEVACSYIEKCLPNAYPRLEETYKDLLVASYCVKLASPNLPEYSMLLYPDLRVLEGVIRETMMKHDLYTSSERKDIGEYFECRPMVTKLKSEHHSNFATEELIKSLENCYDLYRKHRHALFHMEESAFDARTTDTLTEVMKLSTTIAQVIDELYKNCKKL
ncbi:TPA: type II toxin-antitoxin system RnlA family toxin [Vibrio fluvialis]|nr:type II toxin-antitoxin system RnlA family toxin [Vibrio fluvialis]HDV0903040.1 type II toxin-antitoxin system RnlA family toxin [Vibrio fluvialis]